MKKKTKKKLKRIFGGIKTYGKRTGKEFSTIGKTSSGLGQGRMMTNIGRSVAGQPLLRPVPKKKKKQVKKVKVVYYEK